MRRSFFLGVLALATPASAGPTSAPILGGTPATEGQYPSVVAIEAGGGLCTATLITPEWVLTAAHCIQGAGPTSVRVRFDTVNLHTDPGTVVRSSMVIPKPGFSIQSLGQNDIGLVKLERPVTDIKPVPVNLKPEKAPVGIKVTMVGFGATAQGGGGNIGVAYVVDQTSISCSGAAGSDTNLLCFNQISGKGKCNGDSGGPSFAMIGGRLAQVGITSFGDQGCTQFGADTRTDAEKDFLLQHIPQLECTTDDDCGTGKMCFHKKCIVMPFADTGLGSECAGNGECESGTCAMDGDTGYCSSTCEMGIEGACPEGLECIAAGGGGACWPENAGGGGCCDASGATAPTAMLGLVFVGLVLGRKRRRRTCA
jgi:hypothetical protein